MMSFSLWDIVRNLLIGGALTLLLSLVAFVLGGATGMLVLLARIGKWRAPRALAQIHIELFQGTPLLLQLFTLFFGLSLFGLDVPAWLAAGLGLTLFTSAYLAEIWRGCVEAIPPGQWEASSSLALNPLEIERMLAVIGDRQPVLAPRLQAIARERRYSELWIWLGIGAAAGAQQPASAPDSASKDET